MLAVRPKLTAHLGRSEEFSVGGPGGGGLEHIDSTAVTLAPASLDDPQGYKRWLSFIAHEYFHLFNGRWPGP